MLGEFKYCCQYPLNMQVPQERVEKYSDFTRSNSPDGVKEHYDPKRGLEALLSCITPDPKIIVLMAMAANSNEYFYSKNQLYSAVRAYLRNIQVDPQAYPIQSKSTWEYCELENDVGDKVNGSLVNVGAVVKKVDIPTQSGLRTGYKISAAGIDLAVPLGLAAIEFVYKASNLGGKHRYDSMWRVLSTVQSTTEQRRQFAVFHVVRYLVNKRGYHSTTDIVEAVKGDVNEKTARKILSSLGEANVIDYKPRFAESGIITYNLAEEFQRKPEFDADTLYMKIRETNSNFTQRGALAKILGYIREYPSATYNSAKLSHQFNISNNSAATTLKALVDLEILSKEKSLIAKANGLTKILYDVILFPAWYTALALKPYDLRTIDAKKMEIFLDNYQLERSNIGPKGGDEVRNLIVVILEDSRGEFPDGVGLVYITKQLDKRMTRKLKRKSIGHQVATLVKGGLVSTSKNRIFKLSKHTK